MDNASKNASDMIGRLQMQYNRGRQAAITNELVDIITGMVSISSVLSLLTYFQVPAPCNRSVDMASMNKILTLKLRFPLDGLSEMLSPLNFNFCLSRDSRHFRQSVRNLPFVGFISGYIRVRRAVDEAQQGFRIPQSDSLFYFLTAHDARSSRPWALKPDVVQCAER
jgi:hypothetical protein